MFGLPRKRILLSAITTAMLITSIAIPINSYATESNNGILDIGTHIKLQHDSKSKTSDDELSRSTTATKYDPRNESWYKNNITVKNQDDTGLCWAFAATTAGEISYAKQYSKKITLSPVHLGYFFYNRVNDPLGNTAGDKNKITDSDFNYTEVGGSSLLTYQALAGWTGFAEEKIAPISSAGKKLSSDLAYKNCLILKNADILKTDNEVKAAITKNGNVTVGFHFSAASYYNPKTDAYYCDDFESTNHGVTIIGWDDNYSRENFKSSCQPNSDGAWIVQNSYGKSWGDKGYFYISYRDLSLGNAVSLEVEDASDYDYNYQYDGNASDSVVSLYENYKGANIFTVPKDGTKHYLEATGFTSFIRDSSYTGDSLNFNIAVYTNLKDSTNPTSGTKACSFDATVGKNGYHTVSIKDKVGRIYLDAGSKYSIVITPKESVRMGVENEETIANSLVEFQGKISKGQSFYSDENATKWNDYYDYKPSRCCLRIKGLVNVDYVLSTAPSTFKANLYDYDDVALTWNKATGATGYRILYKKSTDSWNEKTALYTTKTSIKKANLADGVKYDFKVTPYKLIDGIKYYSSGYKTCSIYTLKKVGSVKASKSSTNYTKISWKGVSGESGYQVARSAYSSKNFSTIKTTSSSYAKIKTKKNKTYYYKVRAYKKDNGKTIYGPWSSTVKYKLK